MAQPLPSPFLSTFNDSNSEKPTTKREDQYKNWCEISGTTGKSFDKKLPWLPSKPACPSRPWPQSKLFGNWDSVLDTLDVYINEPNSFEAAQHII